MSVALALAEDGRPCSGQSPGNAGRDAEPVDHQSGAGPESPVPGRRRVLVVDDNTGLRESLAEILSDRGYEVAQAENGQAALAVLSGSAFDVLILDLAMPLMDGVELLAEIGPPPPVVIIYSAFAYYHQDEVRRQVGSKVFRMLHKPVHPSELLLTVAGALRELDDD